MQFHLGQFVRIVSAKKFGMIVGINEHPVGRRQYHVSAARSAFPYIVQQDGLVDATKAIAAINRGYLPISNSKKWIGRLTKDVGVLSKLQRSDFRDALRREGEDILKVDADTYRCLQQLWAEAPDLPVKYVQPIPRGGLENIGERVYRKSSPQSFSLPPLKRVDLSKADGGVTTRKFKPAYSHPLYSQKCRLQLPPNLNFETARAQIKRDASPEFKVSVQFPKDEITAFAELIEEAERLRKAAQIQQDERRVNNLVKSDEKARKIEIRAERLKKISGYLKHHMKYGTPQRDLDRLAYFLYRIAHGRN